MKVDGMQYMETFGRLFRGAGAGRRGAADEPRRYELTGSRFACVRVPREVSKNRPDQRSYNECTEKFD